MENILGIRWSEKAVRDLCFWKRANPKVLNRIYALVESIKIDPFQGIGKPEPLKYELSGYWSRRIDKEHRLIYSISGDILFIISCKDHY